MKKALLCAGAALSAFIPFATAEPAADREQLLAIPELAANPLAVQRVSVNEQDGVIVEEIFINGAPFAGKPTKIYGFYAYPKKPGKYPGVVQLHGSGLDRLKPDSAIGYARENYACLSIDWAGPNWKADGSFRAEPRSDFESKGSGAVSIPDGDGDPKHTHFEAVEPSESSITNGVRFVRRAFQFLRSRPEVDSSKLCLSGMSAGAHLSLLVLGVEPGIKAAAVKYGSAFIRELNWGGYYGPISASKPPEKAERWLSVLDPKYGFDKVKTRTLILSGTDDIFFNMLAVLATWKALPGDNALLMLPNDNHTQVANEIIPRQWFDYVLKGAPQWPVLNGAKGELTADAVNLSVNVRGDASKVTFWYKRMPTAKFRFKRGDNAAQPTVRWETVEAQKNGEKWVATLPSLVANEQLAAYATADDVSGTQASSDIAVILSQP